LSKSRAFRDAFEQRRCVVPADWFFEWVGERKDRRPICFHRPDKGIFLFAGLYEIARLSGEADYTTTFTIITTEPNGTVEPIHDRMPVVLPEETVDEWLYERQEPARLQAMLTPVSDDFLVPTAVSRRANSVKNDDPSVLEEAEAETQGSLL
jgi:putative SOS response-associated peptidase YedK